jgi:hypothetical protein
MPTKSSKISRRVFTALSMVAVPSAFTANAGELLALRAQFTRDLALSYEQQVIGVDMEDVSQIFTRIREPILATGVASGSDRGVIATHNALLGLSQIGMHTLLVIACDSDAPIFSESSKAYNLVRNASPNNALVIYAVCRDISLPVGSLRASVLTG